MYESKDKMVSHPEHYQSNGGIEVIDVIAAFTAGLTGMEAYETGNIIKYACRWKKKGGVQDLEKIIWYAQDLIERIKAKDTSNDIPVEVKVGQHVFDKYVAEFGKYYDMENVAWRASKDSDDIIYVWHDISSTDCYEVHWNGQNDLICYEADKEYFETKEPIPFTEHPKQYIWDAFKRLYHDVVSDETCWEDPFFEENVNSILVRIGGPLDRAFVFEYYNDEHFALEEVSTTEAKVGY